MTPEWLHIDINAYFATLAQQEVPALRGKPLAIIKDKGRTCVIAASKEAKQYGVKTGEPLRAARVKCPHIITWPAPFELAWSATRELQSLFNELSPDTEIFSLDEAFIPFHPLRKLYPSVDAYAQLLQQRVRERLGEWVTCNIGIGPTRLLAKMMSEVSPKGSVTQVTEENKWALLASIPFSDVCGVGFRLEEKLARLGVRHPLQISFVDQEKLCAVVGPFWVRELQKIACGAEPLSLTRIDARPFAKSVGRSLTGFRLWKTRDDVWRVCRNLAEEVIMKVRTMELIGRQVGVSLRMGDGTHWGKYVTLKHGVRHINEMAECLQELLVTWPGGAVIKCGVWLSMCEPWQQLQLAPEWWKTERLSVALDAINRKFGLFTVRPATLARVNELIRPEVTGFLGDRQYQLGEV